MLDSRHFVSSRCWVQNTSQIATVGTTLKKGRCVCVCGGVVRVFQVLGRAVGGGDTHLPLRRFLDHWPVKVNRATACESQPGHSMSTGPQHANRATACHGVRTHPEATLLYYYQTHTSTRFLPYKRQFCPIKCSWDTRCAIWPREGHWPEGVQRFRVVLPFVKLKDVDNVHGRHIRHHAAAALVQPRVNCARASTGQLLRNHAVAQLHFPPRQEFIARGVREDGHVGDVPLPVVVDRVDVDAVVRFPLPPLAVPAQPDIK